MVFKVIFRMVWGAMLFNLLASFNATASNTPLKIKHIEVTSFHYSAAQLKVSYEYDGSLREGIMVGVTALTAERVGGEGFAPYPMRKGEHVLKTQVLRPVVFHNNAFKSEDISFLLYSRNASKDKTIKFAIEWPSFAEKFSKEYSSVSDNEKFESIELVRINEAFGFTNELVAALNYKGIVPEKFEFAYVPIFGNQQNSVSVRISEDVKLSDLKLLLNLMESNQINIESIDFYAKSDKYYQFGFVDILATHRDAMGENTTQIIEAIKRADDMNAVFDAANFTPTQPSSTLSNKDKMTIVESLVEMGTPVQIAEAEKLLVELMSNQYYHPSVFLAYAQITLRKFSLSPYILLASLFVIYIILSRLYKRYIRLPDIESVDIDMEAPIMLKQRAIAKQSLPRFIEGLNEGKREALVQFMMQIDDSPEYVWGLAHHVKDNQIIISLEPEILEMLGEDHPKRTAIAIDSVEDWMLIDNDITFGGYTFFAMYQLYQEKYGRLPKRYKEALSRFADNNLALQ